MLADGPLNKRRKTIGLQRPRSTAKGSAPHSAATVAKEKKTPQVVLREFGFETPDFHTCNQPAEYTCTQLQPPHVTDSVDPSELSQPRPLEQPLLPPPEENMAEQGGPNNA